MKLYTCLKKDVASLSKYVSRDDDLFLYFVYLNAKIGLSILNEVQKINKRIDEVDK